ncbi:MAG: NAD(P)H-dependent oxidoreductase subunit E [Anaerolineaceae bacterium]|nr:NAD(P)H-dependent oxidoreductase subunit E [Anaerolineaceae bacterium]
MASPPNDDKRWRIINATMRRHGYKPGALIETLHDAQEAFGYLDETTLHYISANLHVPLSRAYGVATFYNYFRLKPQGLHSCVVCLGTACYIKDSPTILERIQTGLGIQPQQTTPDGQISLSIAHCVGMCWLAPVVLGDEQVIEQMTETNALEKIQEWKRHVT